MVASSLAFAQKVIPLEIVCKEHDLAKVRQSLKGGFADIVGSPTLVSEGAYMQVKLEANGFITMVEHYCDVTLVETVDGLRIKAVPYDVVGGQKVEVMDFTCRKGVYMMIEGAAEELNFAANRPPIPQELGGFGNFTTEMQRLSKTLKGGQPPSVSYAQYPQVGRVFRLVTPGNLGLIQMEEDPARPNQVARMWVIAQLPAGEPAGTAKDDLRIVAGWLDGIRDEVLRDGPKIHKEFFAQDKLSYAARGFEVFLTSQANGAATNRNLLIQDAAAVKATKQGY